MKNNHFYIGSSSNLERRLKEHNSGKNVSTKNKGPYIIVYTEKLQTLSMARKREMEIKSYKGGNAFKKLVTL